MQVHHIDRVDGDCFIAAVSQATGLPYVVAAELVVAQASRERITVAYPLKSNPYRGVYAKTARAIMRRLGWEWVYTYGGGKPSTYFRAEHLPKAPIIVSIHQHYVYVKNHVIYDEWDCSNGGKRIVYGYFRQVNGGP